MFCLVLSSRVGRDSLADAVKVAAALGARVIATSSTDEKLGIAKQLGAAEVVNYRTTPDWAGEVLKLTGGRGVDLVCDVAGSGTLEASMRALRQGGLCCGVGCLTPTKPVDVVMPLIAGGKTCELLSKRALSEAYRVLC